jgi:hypothetical protein
MDTDFRMDVDEINRNIDTAEVMGIYLPLIRKTLLIDTRSDAVDGSMIRVVPMANSMEERFRSVRRLRPRFPRPESITLIPWPKYVTSLKRLNIWDRVVQRFVNVGDMETVRACEKAFNELVALEKKEIVEAIRGERYTTLWEKKKEGD